MKYKEDHIFLNFLKSLKERLEYLSSVNEQFLKEGNFGSTRHIEESKKVAITKLSHSFFNPVNRSDNFGSLIQYANQSETGKVDSNYKGHHQLINSTVLSPIFDKYHFSLRVNPTESKTFEGVTETSTRDFLLNTYHWSTLLSTKAIRRLKVDHAKYLEQLKSLFDCEFNENKFNMDIGFFNVAYGTHHRSQWQWARYKDIKSLFEYDESRLINLENQYQFLVSRRQAK